MVGSPLSMSICSVGPIESMAVNPFAPGLERGLGRGVQVIAPVKGELRQDRDAGRTMADDPNEVDDRRLRVCHTFDGIDDARVGDRACDHVALGRGVADAGDQHAWVASQGGQFLLDPMLPRAGRPTSPC